jgi:serine/threonine protein kinase
MKICPQCDTGYPDNALNCPIHGGLLSEIIDLRPGMLIRKTYRIERLLGKGGMGSVYLARHELMDAPRALKFLSHELNNDEAFTRRFLREGRMLRQVRHKNVVDCGDLERAEDERLFFAMEFVDGPDLRGLMHHAGGRLDVAEALAIAHGIAEGLGAAHALGMVHRDIKPENILMARDKSGWVPKIADFGIVATVESSTVYKTTHGSLLTPPYAAPEQWRGTRASELDGRTDLYALGGVLFEMLTGKTVFEAENYEGWLFAHMQTPPQTPSSLRPELAGWKGLDALVLRLLAKNREDRPRDVAELLGLLNAVRLTTPERQPTVPEIRRATVVEPELVRPSTTPIPQQEIKPEPERQAEQEKIVEQSQEPIEEYVPPVCPSCGTEDPILEGADPVNSWRCESCGKQWTEQIEEMEYSAQQQSIPNVHQEENPFTRLSPEQPPDTEPEAEKPRRGPKWLPEVIIAAVVLMVFFFSWQESRNRDANLSPAKPVQQFGTETQPATRTGTPDVQCSLDAVCHQAESLSDQGHYKKAIPLLDRECNAGVAQACSDLGHLYDLGPHSSVTDSVTQDIPHALNLYTKACDAGNADGCNSLGFLYNQGRGVPQDFSRAADLYSKGCDKGNGTACYNLASQLMNGDGVKEDKEKARQVLLRGCSWGNNAACEWLKQL